MKKIIIGLKIGMTQKMQEDGTVVSVTAVQIVDSKVLDIQEDVDRSTLLVGIESTSEQKLTKPMKGQFDRFKQGYFKRIKQYKVADAST